MTLEKLKKISATLVQPDYKTKWLTWSSSWEMNQAALRLPSSLVTEIILESWLLKAFY